MTCITECFDYPYLFSSPSTGRIGSFILMCLLTKLPIMHRFICFIHYFRWPEQKFSLFSFFPFLGLWNFSLNLINNWNCTVPRVMVIQRNYISLWSEFCHLSGKGRPEVIASKYYGIKNREVGLSWRSSG